MARFSLGLGALMLLVAGLGYALWIATYDLPIHFGWMFVDYPDPLHPGHLKGVRVSTSELLLKSTVAATALAAGLLGVKARRATKD